MNFGVAKFFGAIDKRFQDKYNYLIDLLSSSMTNISNRLPGNTLYTMTFKTGVIANGGQYADDLVIPAGRYLIICSNRLVASGNAWFGEAGAYVSTGDHYMFIEAYHTSERIMVFTAETTVNLYNQTGSPVTVSAGESYFQALKI